MKVAPEIITSKLSTAVLYDRYSRYYDTIAVYLLPEVAKIEPSDLPAASHSTIPDSSQACWHNPLHES